MALIGDLQPYFQEFNRLLKSMAGAACRQQNLVTTAGVGQIPVGLRGVTITSVAGPTTLTFTDGTTYAIATGEVFSTELLGGVKPVGFTIAGGTWKWYGYAS